MNRDPFVNIVQVLKVVLERLRLTEQMILTTGLAL